MKSKLFLFILITYLVTIIFHAVLQNLNNPISYLSLIMIIPLIVAAILHKFIFKERFIPKLGLKVGKVQWYFVAIVIPIFLSFDFIMPFNKWLELLFVGLTIASMSAFFEEVVWRGFVRYEMRKKSLMFTYLMTAIIWTIWHIPISVLYLYTESLFQNTLFYCIQLFLISLIISWIRDKSNTVITAAIFHGMINVFYFS